MSTLPSTVATADFAALVGLTPRRIQQLVSEKVLPSGGHGKLSLADALQAFVKWRVENETRAFRFDGKRNGAPVSGGGDLGSELDAERIRKLRLENDEREGKLHQDGILEGLADLVSGSLLVEFAAYPAQMTDDLAFRRKLEDGLDGMRTRHADRLIRALSDIRRGRDPLAMAAGDEPEDEEDENE